MAQSVVPRNEVEAQTQIVGALREGVEEIRTLRISLNSMHTTLQQIQNTLTGIRNRP